jgi:acyl-CoA thioesterase I
MQIRVLIFWLATLAALTGCGTAPKEAPKTTAPARETMPATPAEAPDPRPVIAAFGDSLTAGYGVEAGLSYPDWLQKRLDSENLAFRVVNLGISGDTTSGGVARLDEALLLKPAVVILALGANDGLRGLPAEATRANLAEMIDRCQAANVPVLLGGMTLPRNYGADYVRDFENIFKELAREKKTLLIPFLLDGVATDPNLMQSDALHPTAEGNRRVAATVFQYLRPLLR